MYILEGNVGAGKSTFLSLIAKHLPEVRIILEPIDNWQHQIYGQSLLTNFYRDPKRWAYTFEALTLINRAKEYQVEQYHPYPFKIIERSIYSGYHCFAQNSYIQKFLSDLEWELYKQWFDFLTINCTQPSGFIYLRVSPEICYERIKKRNRYAEKTLSLTYLKQIHKQHENLFIEKRKNFLNDMPILILDCDKEFETNNHQLHQLMHKVQRFFTETENAAPQYKHCHVHELHQ